jgi:homocitrate synthase
MMRRVSAERIAIIDSTLREGGQSAHAALTTEGRQVVARALDRFGVQYIELTNPAASARPAVEFERMAALGLKAKLVAHIRCREEDVRAALGAGAKCLNIFLGTSPLMRRHSHGMDMGKMIKRVSAVLGLVSNIAPDTEVCLSAEDAFRTPENELMEFFDSIVSIGGVSRLGAADTVGVANPFEVFSVTAMLKERFGLGIKFHGHNDTGCAVSNSHAALMAGATHVDVSVFGIGERSGITPLAGLIARLYADDPTGVAEKFRLNKIEELHDTVADITGCPKPIGHPIVGEHSFSHIAGVHQNAVINNPETYEPFPPDAFGRNRNMSMSSRNLGWHGLWHLASANGIDLGSEETRRIARDIREGREALVLDADNIMGVIAKYSGASS